jgi:hypothetical protein
MPITSPHRKDSDDRPYSEHIICENFVFKPTQVDAFYHTALNEKGGVTVLKFKSYTQDVRDPERRLFDYLVKRFAPMTSDEDR